MPGGDEHGGKTASMRVAAVLASGDAENSPFSFSAPTAFIRMCTYEEPVGHEIGGIQVLVHPVAPRSG